METGNKDDAKKILKKKGKDYLFPSSQTALEYYQDVYGNPVSDERIQQLAWEKHGFRTSSYDISSAGGEGGVTGIPEQVTAVMNMPEYDAMKKIIDYLQ